MLSLGLGLSLADFRRIASKPQIVAVGLACQIILFPLFAFAVVGLFGMTGSMAVGIILLASCPAGNVSGLITQLARGDVALSVSLTAVNSLLCVLTLPLVLHWAQMFVPIGELVELRIGDVAVRTFLVATLPVLLGVALNEAKPQIASTVRPYLTKTAVVLLGVIICGALAANWLIFVDNLRNIGGALAVLFVLAVGSAYAIPAYSGFGSQASRTIAIEVGAQNGALGILIATMFTPGISGFNDYTLASAVYGVVMYFALAPLVIVFRRTRVAPLPS